MKYGKPLTTDVICKAHAYAHTRLLRAAYGKETDNLHKKGN